MELKVSNPYFSLGVFGSTGLLLLVQWLLTSTSASDYLVWGLDKYCQAPVEMRAQFRSIVNGVSPHHIVVQCEGDREKQLL